MATQPRLVNKQFNTPIGLYSQDNIKEVLQREQQILANGAVGIDFQSSHVGKPANLQNSAVLRMLEEEEYRSHGRTVGVKRVAWPPPQYEGDLDSPFVEQNAVSAQGGPQYPSAGGQQQQQQQPPTGRWQQQPQQQGQQQQPSYRPLKPLDVASIGSSSSPLASPIVNQVPAGYRPATPSRGWAPVHSPVSTPGAQPYAQPQFQQPPQAQANRWQPQQSQQYQAQAQSQQYQAQAQSQPGQSAAQQANRWQQPQQSQQYQAQAQSQPGQSVAQLQQPRVQQGPGKHVEPPPTTITLRQQAPVSQLPPPIITSQPATATLKGQVAVGSKHLRGDLKWPPENVRQRMTEERELLEELARGPAVRPMRPDKDYTPFFEAHALNSTYPGYKIPPGTQFYRPM